MAQTNTEQGGKDLLLKVGNGFSNAEAVTFTAATDLVGLTAHGLVAGDVVKFATVVTSTVPVVGTLYYVISSGLTANAFKISTTPEGTAANIDVDGTGTMAEAFQTIAGLRSKSFSANAEEIEITNHDSDEWKTLLDGAGIRSVSRSGDGVFKDEATFKRARNYFLNQNIRNWQIVTNSGGDYWQGCFKITSLEQSGDYNAESTYSMSMSSSGAVTYTEV